MSTKWWIGCSGWSYKDWIGRFYPEGLEEKRWLEYYASKFNTSEINSTFYQIPRHEVVWSWTRVPTYFKLYKGITHEAQLRNVEKLLDTFFESLKPLAVKSKLGPILIQLPPTYTKTLGLSRLESFLSMLPSSYQYALEVRHQSLVCEELFGLLEQYNVAFVIIDGPPTFPRTPLRVTADFVYIRFHGRYERFPYAYRYKDEELAEWAPKIKQLAEEVKEVWLFFNNHFRAAAPLNAFKMIQLLGLRQEELTPGAQTSLLSFF